MGILDINVKDIGSIFEGFGKGVNQIRSAITGDMPPETKALLEKAADEMEHAGRLAQMRINETEARHSSLFVAGWRPAVGWVCVAGLTYVFLLHPLLLWINEIWRLGITNPPTLELDMIWKLVGAMLGMGGLRSFDKFKGKA